MIATISTNKYCIVFSAVIYQTLESLLNTAIQIIKDDPDRMVVIAAMVAIEEIMRDLQEDFVNQCPTLFPKFAEVIASVLNNNVSL